MNKTDINNLIATIDDGGVNSAAEVRAVLEGYRDNDYGDIINENSSMVGVVTEKSLNPNVFYTVSIVKQGRKVTISGAVYQNSGSILNGSGLNDYVFKILTGDYTPDTSSIWIKPAINATTNEITSLNFDGSKLRITGMFPNNQFIHFQIEYFTLN